MPLDCHTVRLSVLTTVVCGLLLTSCILPSGRIATSPPKMERVYRLPADRDRPVKIHVNQLFYPADGPKRAVVESTEPQAEFEVVDMRTGAPVLKEKLSRIAGFSQWGGGPYYYVADFSRWKTPGDIVLRVGNTSSSPTGVRDQTLFDATFDMVLGYFSKSRADEPEILRADANAPFFGKGRTRDVRGGWYDASGDISKYLSHLSYANFMNPQQIPLVAWALAFVHDRSRDGRLTEKQRAVLAAEAVWGADYLVRILDESGFFYINVFDRWSGEPRERAICAFEHQTGTLTDEWQAGMREGAGMSIAALARISTLEHRGDFTGETYLDKAVIAFAHLREHNMAYLDDGKENIIDDYSGLMAAAELFAATGDPAYLDAARDRARRLSERLHSRGYFIADDGNRPFWHASDAGLPVMALVRYLEVEKDPSRQKAATEIITRHLEYLLVVTSRTANPYGYARQSFLAGSEVTDGFFIPHINESEYWWQGENARLASLAAAAVAGGTAASMDGAIRHRLNAFAADQMNWILGSNPFDMCFLRGVGQKHPPDYSPLPNHKNHGDLDGGIANGITGSGWDGSGIAFWGAPGFVPQGNDRWRWLEQWLPHSAWFLIAATVLAESGAETP